MHKKSDTGYRLINVLRRILSSAPEAVAGLGVVWASVLLGGTTACHSHQGYESKNIKDFLFHDDIGYGLKTVNYYK